MKNYAAARFAPRGWLEVLRKNLKLVVLDARGGWKRVGLRNPGERKGIVAFSMEARAKQNVRLAAKYTGRTRFSS